MGFRRAAGFAHHNDQGSGEARAQLRQGAAYALGIDVVEKMEREPFTLGLQRPDHQQRAQTRSPDPNPKHIGKCLAARRLNPAADHVLGKSLDPVNLRGDVGRNCGIWGQLRAAQPIMADLASFIRIGDRPGLEGGHRSKG